MDQNGVVWHRRSTSTSTDRFLSVFSPPKIDSGESAIASGGGGGDELNEDDVLWTGRDFTESQTESKTTSFRNPRLGFKLPEHAGILAALPERSGRPVIYQKHATTSFNRDFPAIPKPSIDREQNWGYSQSMPASKFQHSAPVKVPMMPKAAPRRSGGELADVDIDDDDDEEMLPPHEMVARGSARSPKTTFSVLEGVGRTLKGRDLRQVRNAVFRQTGFID